jgi:hypothetical protein
MEAAGLLPSLQLDASKRMLNTVKTSRFFIIPPGEQICPLLLKSVNWHATLMHFQADYAAKK